MAWYKQLINTRSAIKSYWYGGCGGGGGETASMTQEAIEMKDFGRHVTVSVFV
jgi:hypothetical protein